MNIFDFNFWLTLSIKILNLIAVQSIFPNILEWFSCFLVIFSLLSFLWRHHYWNRSYFFEILTFFIICQHLVLYLLCLCKFWWSRYVAIVTYVGLIKTIKTVILPKMGYLPPVTLLSITFFAQDEKIDRIHHSKADEILFPTVYRNLL